MADEDEQSALAWQKFLTAYAAGDFPSDACPARPPIPPGLLRPYNPDTVPVPWAFADAPLYSTAATISIADARAIRNYYCENHYLPPPRSPLEGSRHETIDAYNLYSPKQLSNIQAATDVIAAFFPGTVCTFSLFHDHIQKHFCLSGNEGLIAYYKLEPGLRIPAEDSLCGHAVLHDHSIFYVKELKTDWRYLSNPFVFAGFKSFIGSSVSLEVNPLKDEGGPRIVVGTLNVCFIEESLEVLTAAQRRVLRHVTAMLETQLRATWEGDQRTKDGRARLALAELIQAALVDIRLENMDGEIEKQALEQLCNVLPDVDSVVLIDTGAVDMGGKFIPGIGTPCEVIATAGAPYRPIPQQQLLDCLNSASSIVYQSDKSGLEQYLDPEVQSHLFLLLRSTDRPFYLIIATSSTPHYAFPAADINIIRSVGSVLRARAVQCGVMLADAAKTSFLSSISHELRTPMHGVKASLELIRRSVDGEDWEEIEGPLDMAEASGRALLNILNDVLDFGKNDWAKADEAEEIDLARSAEEIAAVCLAQHGNRGEALRLEFEDRDWSVVLNEAKFNRVIMNGLTNAIKFTPNGEIVLSLTTTPDRHACVVQIKDNGIGIDADALPRLMQPFTKMDNDSPGAGLGLYITKALVEKMGGELTLTSVKGQGTTFTATLPILLLRGQDPAPIKSYHLPSQSTVASRRTSTTTNPPSPRTSSIIANHDHPLRVLIIDDNEICRKILRMAFKRADMSVTCVEAENGQVGLDLFDSFAPDIVLTDVSMPVMDGVTAAGKMRELLAQQPPRRCRIYALTGLGSSDPRIQSIGVHGKAALDGWLVKGKDMLDAVYKILKEVQ